MSDDPFEALEERLRAFAGKRDIPVDGAGWRDYVLYRAALEHPEQPGRGHQEHRPLQREKKLTPRKSGKRTLILVEDLRRHVEVHSSELRRYVRSLASLGRPIQVRDGRGQDCGDSGKGRTWVTPRERHLDGLSRHAAGRRFQVLDYFQVGWDVRSGRL
jgi:hypothetical protein